MSTYRNSLKATANSSSNRVPAVRPTLSLRRSMKLLLCLAAILAPACLVTGCGVSATAIDSPSEGLAIQGRIHSGLHEVAGAHVYLLAANTTGYGNASVSLLNSSVGQSDSIGGYVLTDSNGFFSIPSGFTCAPNAQVYLYGVGGDAGTGSGANPSAGYLAVLGNCPDAANHSSGVPTVWMNEVTTVAAAYAFSAYATDATHVSSSGTPLAQIGIQNAFAAAANLVNSSNGIALATTPAGNGTAPQMQVNAVANILSACINSASGSPACSTLLSTATSDGTGSGAQPTDTATAAINIAHHPSVNVSTLFALAGNGQTFAPGLVAAPADFSMAIAFTGGGLTLASQPAVDAQGNVWIADTTGTNGNGALVELSSLGAPISPAGGFVNPSLSAPDGVVLDLHGNAWVANLGGNSLSVFSSQGAFQTTATAPGGGPLFPQYMAFDPTGNLWAASSDGVNSSLMTFSSTGAYKATYTGNGLGMSDGLAIDRGGNVWVSQPANVSEFTSTGAPAPNSPFLANASSVRNLAFDDASRLWVLNDNDSVSLMTQGGPVGGTTFSPANNSSALAQALDGAGIDWIVSSPATFPVLNYNLTAVSSSGNTLAGYTLNTGGFNPGGIAIDGSGNIWVTGGNQVLEFLGAASPVVTPVAANLDKPYAAAASRP